MGVVLRKRDGAMFSFDVFDLYQIYFSQVGVKLSRWSWSLLWVRNFLLLFKCSRNCEAREERWNGGGVVCKSDVAQGCPKDFWEVQSRVHGDMHSTRGVWMSVPYLEVPGENWKPKTSVSVSIWNLIYYIVLKFGVRNISDSTMLIMFFHTGFSGTAPCPNLTLVLRSLFWLTQWGAPTDSYIWHFSL